MKHPKAMQYEAAYKPSSQATFDVALIWGLRESGRLPFLIKEGVHKRRLYRKGWEETELTGWARA